MTAPAALHLLHGWWIASCPDCGHELGRRRDQEAAERVGQRRRCPICRPTPASRLTYRGLHLDGPLAELHRAVDRLSWDTVPTPLDEPPASPPTPPRRGRRQVDGQAHLLDPSDREESA